MSFIGYKMTYDTGFAPNPFHGVLTLATCKPIIRCTKKKGDWIAGFVSKKLVKNALKIGVKNLPEGGLIYLMKITEDPMILYEYFNDNRYKIKQPIQASSNPIMSQGDNIYYHDENKQYAQVVNNNHDSSHINRDLKGKNVLISKEFYYFGRNALITPGGWKNIANIKGRTFYISKEWEEEIFKLIEEKGYQGKYQVHGDPCLLDLKCA